MTDRERYLEAVRECGRLAAELQRTEARLERNDSSGPAFHRGLGRIYSALRVEGKFEDAVERATQLWQVVYAIIGTDSDLEGELAISEAYRRVRSDHD